MRESKRKRYLWLAVLGLLFALYCLYAATYSAWMTAYYTDKIRIEIHALWFYVFVALSAVSFILSGWIVYKFIGSSINSKEEITKQRTMINNLRVETDAKKTRVSPAC